MSTIGQQFQPRSFSELERGVALNDENIDSFLNILKNKYSFSFGLNKLASVFLCSKLEETVQLPQKTGKFLEVLFVSGPRTSYGHYICFCSPQREFKKQYDVIVYDSLNSKTLFQENILTILARYICENDPYTIRNEIKVKFPHLQQQTGEMCGYMACLYCFTLVNGYQPEHAVYNLDTLASEFAQILRNNTITKTSFKHTFPTLATTRTESYDIKTFQIPEKVLRFLKKNK